MNNRHPTVNFFIEPDFQSISFLTPNNSISLGDSIDYISNKLAKFYHTLGDVSVVIKEDSKNSSDENDKNNDKSSNGTISFFLASQFLRLIFDYSTQRLIQIKLEQVKYLLLTYRDKFFTHPGQSITPSLRQIDTVFGSTQPGDIIDNAYVLKYFCGKNKSSIQFTFKNSATNNNNSDDCSSQQKIKVHDNLLCSDINLLAVSDSQNSNESHISKNCPNFLKSLSVQCISDPTNQEESTYCFDFRIKKFKKQTENPKANEKDQDKTNSSSSSSSKFFNRKIYLNNSIQTIESELGSPDEIFYKSEREHVNIGKNFCDNNTIGTDFYYNYYSYGVDLLFCGVTKKLKKVILHTCVPEHEDFGHSYSPCNFNFLAAGEFMVTAKSNFDNETMQKMINAQHSNENKNLMLLTRNNQVESKNCLPTLLKVTGSNKNSGFVYHSSFGREIYEFTASGKLAVVTIY